VPHAPSIEIFFFSQPAFSKTLSKSGKMVEDVLAGRASPVAAIARARAGIEAILRG